MLRQIPIWEKEAVVGFVDLALERAFVYRPNEPSEVVDLPQSVLEREKEARFHMLEQLADYDEELLEELLLDVPPSQTRVFGDLVKELREGLICPVLLGSAENGNGIFRLLKALRHEVPAVHDTARRLKVETTPSAAYVFKTLFTGHGGKLSIARVLTGEFADGATITGGDNADERIAGVFGVKGEDVIKRPVARGRRYGGAGAARRGQHRRYDHDG